MPYLETVAELAEALADMLSIYGQGLKLVGVENPRDVEDVGLYDHAEDCQCRMCWTAAMERRIHAAVQNEHVLKGGTQ